MSGMVLSPGSALSRLYGNVQSEITRGDEVGIRAFQGSKVPSTAKNLVQKLARVPGTLPGDNAVIQEARDAATAQESAYMTKQFLRFRKQRIQAGVETYTAGAEFAMDVMKQAESLGQIDTRFSRAMLRHGLQMDTMQQQVEGYVASHNNFMTMITSA